MTDRTQYILEFSVLIFIGVLVLIILAIWILNRQHLMAAKAVEVAAKNDDEHFGMFRYFKQISGRIQWLMSKDIAEELGKVRERKGDDPIPPHEDTQ